MTDKLIQINIHSEILPLKHRKNNKTMEVNIFAQAEIMGNIFVFRIYFMSLEDMEKKMISHYTLRLSQGDLENQLLQSISVFRDDLQLFFYYAQPKNDTVKNVFFYSLQKQIHLSFPTMQQLYINNYGI